MVVSDELVETKEVIATNRYNSNSKTSQEQKCVQGTLQSDYRFGSSATGVYGKIDLKTSGSFHGMGQGITAEVILPNGSLSRGQVNAIDLELGGGASTSWGSAGPVTFIRCGVWGSGTQTAMNSSGYILDVQGLTSTANGCYDATQAPAAMNASFKVRFGTTDYWVPMSTTAS